MPRYHDETKIGKLYEALNSQLLMEKSFIAQFFNNDAIQKNRDEASMQKFGVSWKELKNKAISTEQYHQMQREIDEEIKNPIYYMHSDPFIRLKADATAEYRQTNDEEELKAIAQTGAGIFVVEPTGKRYLFKQIPRAGPTIRKEDPNNPEKITSQKIEYPKASPYLAPEEREWGRAEKGWGTKHSFPGRGHVMGNDYEYPFDEFIQYGEVPAGTLYVWIFDDNKFIERRIRPVSGHYGVDERGMKTNRSFRHPEQSGSNFTIDYTAIKRGKFAQVYIIPNTEFQHAAPGLKGTYNVGYDSTRRRHFSPEPETPNKFTEKIIKEYGGFINRGIKRGLEPLRQALVSNLANPDLPDEDIMNLTQDYRKFRKFQQEGLDVEDVRKNLTQFIGSLSSEQFKQYDIVPLPSSHSTTGASIPLTLPFAPPFKSGTEPETQLQRGMSIGSEEGLRNFTRDFAYYYLEQISPRRFARQISRTLGGAF